MDTVEAQSVFLDKLAARPLARSSALPLHWQCAELLQVVIEEAHYPSGVPLPPEKEMARAMGISRPTLRQAMSRLSSDGILHSQRGVGAFPLRGGLARRVGLSSLFRDLQAEGRVPTTQVLLLEAVAAPADVAGALHIAPGDPLLHLERVRFADGVPVVLTRSHLSLPSGVSISREQLENDGLYSLLHRLAGIELVGGTQTVSARLATSEEAQHLRLSLPAPVMVAHRVAFDTAGRGVEYVHIIYTEQAELISDLRGTSARPTRFAGTQPSPSPSAPSSASSASTLFSADPIRSS